MITFRGSEILIRCAQHEIKMGDIKIFHDLLANFEIAIVSRLFQH